MSYKTKILYNIVETKIMMRKELSIPHLDILVAVAKSRRGAISLVKQKQHSLEGSRYTRKTERALWQNMWRYRIRILEGFPNQIFSQVHK